RRYRPMPGPRGRRDEQQKLADFDFFVNHFFSLSAGFSLPAGTRSSCPVQISRLASHPKTRHTTESGITCQEEKQWSPVC
ncbi:MAG: hypothetical protein ACK5PS_03760, partial [Desulfopila sp.]